MNRSAVTAEIAGATAVQLALAAVLAHATKRATLLETEELCHEADDHAPLTQQVRGHRNATGR